MPMAGRASPAAHPQTEFTTIMTVPFVLWITLSTSSGVRVSSTPKRVRSSLIGLIKGSGYGISRSLAHARQTSRMAPWLHSYIWGTRSGEIKMNAIEVLKKDHQEVQRLFSEFM